MAFLTLGSWHICSWRSACLSKTGPRRERVFVFPHWCAFITMRSALLCGVHSLAWRLHDPLLWKRDGLLVIASFNPTKTRLTCTVNSCQHIFILYYGNSNHLYRRPISIAQSHSWKKLNVARHSRVTNVHMLLHGNCAKSFRKKRVGTWILHFLVMCGFLHWNSDWEPKIFFNCNLVKR